MISKKDILKIARHVVRRDKGFPDRRLIHPTRDWIFGLLISAALFLGASTYVGYDFLDQFQSADEPIVTDKSVVLYQHEGVLEVLEVYGKRTGAFATLRGDTSNATVPVSTEETESGEPEEVLEDDGEDAVEQADPGGGFREE